MTDEKLAEIKARAEAATPGPWWHHSYYIYCGPRDSTVSDRVSNPNKLAHSRRFGHERADATFIAAAREDIPALLAEVERLRGLLDALDRQTRFERELRDRREAALLEIVRAMATTPPAYREQPEEWYCVHCGANFIPVLGRGNDYDEAVAYRMLRHSAACPITKARALLADDADTESAT